MRYVAFLFLLLSQFSFAASAPTILDVHNTIITVDGKSKIVYTITQPNGTWGYYGVKGQEFNVIVKNDTNVPTVIHWHGLILPNAMDGVPNITQPPIPPKGEYHYQFKLVQAGTFWMHSHMGLQTQDLMAAPFIINDPHDPYQSNQQVVVMLQDFTFKTPIAVFNSLRSNSANMSMTMTSSKQDLNDVTYDAFLTNYHTLKQPEIVMVKPNSIVRLRFIDGASGSNFWLQLGKLSGTAIAFDGSNIKPLQRQVFQIAMGQRLDVLVKIPRSGGVFPILAQVEGLHNQTGLILTTSNNKIPAISELANNIAPALTNQQELLMHSLRPLIQKPINRVVMINLNGNMQKYIWMINGQAWPKVVPITLTEGQRVEFIFNNQSNMAHPMHFHGHDFELVGINDTKINDGLLHDTILVLPHTQMKVIFDADYPGKWMLHCHMAYHQEAGMMTFVEIKPEITH